VARVFISYAHGDLTRAREVHRWLIEAGHEVFLDQDSRDGIAVGEQWRQRLCERLRWADAVVCVMTFVSVVSSWCTAEIAMAQEWGSRLLPLRVEPDADHPLLADVHHIDLAQNPAAACVALVAALRRIDATGGSGWPDDRCPFPGLRPFEVGWHRVFFGRAEEIKALTELVRSAAEGTALVVVGPSGCGKSSLVRAGLLPVMADEPGWRTLPAILPGADPVGALARELAAAARRIGLGWTVEQVERRLDGGGLTPLADELLLADPDGPQRRLLVVVDQFEELLTQAAPSQRARFAELLRPALTGPVRVVATLRPEFVDQLLADPELAVLPTRVYPLRPLRREALRQVIEGPAQLAGIKVEAHLVARLVQDTDSGEALPLLAFTLAQLAEGVSRGGQLSIARYEQLGRVQGALTRQADKALAEAVGAAGRDREEVITGLLRLVTVDEHGHPTRWRVRRDELPAPVVTELDAFVARRLLSTDTDNGTVVIGVAHEAFLSAWPPLAQAITANVTALRARHTVEHAATEWDDDGRPPARLWAGGELAAAVADTGARICSSSASPPGRRGPARWLPRWHQVLVTNRVELSTQARDFLHAGIRRDRSRSRRATTVLSVAIILALVAAGVAFVEQRNAEQGQRIAAAGRLVSDAEAARSTDLRAALLLGLAAHRLHPTGETHASLVNTLAAGPYLGTLTGHTSSVNSAVFAPDGHTLATGSKDSTVILWDLTDPVASRRLGQPLTGHRKPVNSVAFTPDGRTLATGSDDNTVILWDVTDRAQPRQLGSPLTGHTDAVTAMALAPDGRTLITGSADRTVIRWDLTDLAQPRQLGSPLSGHTDAVSSVALTSDGYTLATGGADGAVISWDVTDRVQPRQLGPLLGNAAGGIITVAFAPGGHMLATSTAGETLLWDLTDPAQPHQLGLPLSVTQSLFSQVSQVSLVRSVAFAPDGRTLATSTHTGATVLWDLTNPAQPHPVGPPLTGHTSEVDAVAFSPDGRTLTTGSADSTVILWGLADPVQPQLLGPPLAGHGDWVYSVAFASDGRTLATGSLDKTAILWDVTDPTQPRRLDPPLTGHRNRVFGVAFNPAGHTLATGSEDGTVILWDVTDPARPRRFGMPLTGHTGSVSSMAFTRDGRSLVTGSADRTAILWDVTDPAQPRQLGPPLTGHTGSVLSVALSPDGRSMVTGSVDATAIRWDVTDPAQPRQLGPPLIGHAGRVNSVAFSSDGRTVATGSNDQTVILWDVADPAQPHRLGAPLTSSTFGIPSVAFSPDGRTLATGNFDGTVILWDVTDPTQPSRLGLPLTSNTLSVLSVAFSPDGRTLATGNLDGTATLWGLKSFNQLRDHAVERACSITRGGLDQAEWNRYLPGLPYQASCPG